MKYGKIRFIWGLLLLMAFVLLFLAPATEWTLARKALLAPHVSTSVGYIFHKTLLAAFIVVITALLGRWYCGLLCPAGLVQDLFAWLGMKIGLGRIGYRKLTVPGLPVVILGVVVVAALLGNLPMPDNQDPIAMFGRLALGVRDLLHPPLGGLDALYYIVLGLAALFLVLLPLFLGRWFCEVCPVAGVFYLTARLPGKRLAIDGGKCVSCGRCARVCPAHCLDAREKRIESERCVMCLRCGDACAPGAIRYGSVGQGPEPAPENGGARRSFLDATAAAAGAAALFSARDVGRRLGFASQREGTKIAPPGSGGDDNHRWRCVTCQACVPACPVGIIRPQGPERRPTLDFSRGYCQYNCVACSESCPAGVFQPLTLEEKHRTRLAGVALALEKCVVKTLGHECGACAEVCPTHAVSMVPQEGGGPTLPSFEAEYCIGCGACVHVCPAHPRAFTAVGLARHERSEGVRVLGFEGGEYVDEPPPDEVTDFPF